MRNNHAVTVLIVDDDSGNLTSLKKIFEREGNRVLTAESGQAALECCREHQVDVVLTDMMMPGMTGLDLVRALRTVAKDAEVVVMTAHGTIESAVDAMRHGAYDFVEKPLKRMHIVRSVRKAAERRALVSENRDLRRELSALKQKHLVGNAPSLRQAINVASQAAPSSANVLILGESGTGKELLAKHIHESSGRSGAFVAVNLAALPEGIVESELFGHEKGAFTGAHQRREGRVAQAHGGTLFLDEIAELPTAVQVKLLRVLQEGEFEPLGGKTLQSHCRIIAATNRELRDEVDSGRFREDLFYRLNVIAVTCPPLRERRDDIPLLVDHFLMMYAEKNHRTNLRFTDEAMRKLQSYGWPGNVRELQNAIERAVVLSRGDTIDARELPTPIVDTQPVPESLTFPLGTPLEEIERRAVLATLRHTEGDKRLAAQLLGVATRTIYRKLEQT